MWTMNLGRRMFLVRDRPWAMALAHCAHARVFDYACPPRLGEGNNTSSSSSSSLCQIAWREDFVGVALSRVLSDDLARAVARYARGVLRVEVRFEDRVTLWFASSSNFRMIQQARWTPKGLPVRSNDGGRDEGARVAVPDGATCATYHHGRDGSKIVIGDGDGHLHFTQSSRK